MSTSNAVNDVAGDSRLGLGARVIGVLTSPRETFERVAADPHWLGVLALSVGFVAATGALLVSADFAQRESLAQQVAVMEGFGVNVTDEMYAEIEAGIETAPYFGFASILISVPLICVLLAGLLFGVGHGILGAAGSFRQVFAVVAHAGVVFMAQSAFVVPLNFAIESIEPPSTLAAFTPMLEEGAFAYNLLSAIDLFHVWWVMILAIGLAVLWKRPTKPIAVTLYGIHAGIALLFAAVRTSFGF